MWAKLQILGLYLAVLGGVTFAMIRYLGAGEDDA